MEKFRILQKMYGFVSKIQIGAMVRIFQKYKEHCLHKYSKLLKKKAVLLIVKRLFSKYIFC